MKSSMDTQMKKVISKMKGMFGNEVDDLLTDEEINKLLRETFNKFDKDGSGRLELSEFHKAWEFLGLQGSTEEITRAFNEVDTNASGTVDRREFTDAIRDNRASELSLSV